MRAQSCREMIFNQKCSYSKTNHCMDSCLNNRIRHLYSKSGSDTVQHLKFSDSYRQNISFLFFKARTERCVQNLNEALGSPRFCSTQNPKRFSGQQEKLKSTYFSFGSTWKRIFQSVMSFKKKISYLLSSATKHIGWSSAGEPPPGWEEGPNVLTGSILGLNFAGGIINPLPAAAAKSCASEALMCGHVPKTQT